MPSFIVPGVGGEALMAGVVVADSSKLAEVALSVTGILGNIVAFVMTVLPIHSFLAPICSDKSVGDRTAYGHIVTLFSSVAMFLYALPSNTDAMASLVINGISTLMQLIYVSVFMWFATGAVRRRALYLVGQVLIVSILLPCLVFTKVVGTLFVSVTAAIAAFLAYCSILVDMVQAMIIKRADNMDPLYEVLLSFANAFTSAACGSLSTTPNFYMAVPNGIGALILVGHVTVYLAHREPRSVFHGDVLNFGYELNKMFKSPV